MAKQLILKRGYIVWATLNPVRGHEQDGRRPVFILSPEIHNTATGLVVICPITSHIKGYPFEVAVSVKEVTGAILVNQIRTIDIAGRDIAFIGTADSDVLKEVQAKLSALLIQ